MKIYYKKSLVQPYTYPEPVPLPAIPLKLFTYGGPNVEKVEFSEIVSPGVVAQ